MLEYFAKLLILFYFIRIYLWLFGVELCEVKTFYLTYAIFVAFEDALE